MQTGPRLRRGRYYASMVAKDASGNEPNQPTSGPGSETELAPIDFSTFLLSLGSSAMVNLGKMPTPNQESSVDLVAARQIIDILEILEKKTAGNLEDSEQKLLSGLLHDLRVQFLDAQKK